MRPHIRSLVRTSELIFDFPQSIVEIGSYQVSGQEDIADMRSFFDGKTYIGCDMRKGKGVDRIEDIEKLSFGNETVGTVLLLDTLEHVKDPLCAMEEVSRVLLPDGYAILTSVMDFPIHDFPFDYWRFTPEAFNHLCSKFPKRAVVSWGNPEFPHTLISIASKSPEKNHFDEDIEELIKTLPTFKPYTMRVKAKLILAKRLRMYETIEKLKHINRISFNVYYEEKIVKSGERA